MPQAVTFISHHCLFWVGTELVGSVWPIYANKCSNPLNQRYAKYKVEPILPVWVTVVAMELWFCYCCVKAAREVLFPIFAFLEKICIILWGPWRTEMLFTVVSWCAAFSAALFSIYFQCVDHTSTKFSLYIWRMKSDCVVI